MTQPTRLTQAIKPLGEALLLAATMILAGCAGTPQTDAAEPAQPAEAAAADNESRPSQPDKDTDAPAEEPPHPAAAGFTRQCNRSLDEAKQAFNAIERRTGDDEPIAVLNAVNDLDILIEKAAGKASLYRNVHPNAEVRKAADTCQQQFAELTTDISLSRPMYELLASLEADGLDEVTRRFLKDMLEDFQRAGVSEDEATRERVRALKNEIVKLGQEFNRNMREDVRYIELESAEALDGLPRDYIDNHPPGEDGKIRISTDYPDYFPYMQYAHNDDHRLALYKAFRNRGHPANEEILKNLIAKRHELARLLGYRTYAELATEDKMIETPDKALSFINKISTIATARADQDYAVLLNRLRQIDPEAREVGGWQKMYLEELIKQEKYQIDSREVRQYFPYAKVRDGIFNLVETLFHVTIRPWQRDEHSTAGYPLWHESVEAYEVVENGEIIGRFYLDMHPREGKYKHAAHFGFQTGVKGRQLPMAALICNFPGGDGKPGYLEHSQVETFLHEFGHLIHSIFAGQQRWLAQSGIATERDFVEAPSQMLEEWIWDRETLQTFAVNSEGETIPNRLVEKMNAARDFGRGLFVKHQMYYASLSLNYYNRPPETFDLTDLMIRLKKQYSPYGYVDGTHFYASFGHLYGYSAVYYTYMWSLVIAADMFSEFKAHGMRSPDVALRYRRTVLEPGGTKDAAELVEDFLGRPYSFHAFAAQLNRSPEIETD